MTRAEKLEEIAKLAAKMREAQRLYYRRRDQASLIEAKELERMLDQALEWLDP